MASRIEQLISQQRQLMFDMSHELRSPLARLNVALDLEREKNDRDPVLDQMQQDLNTMNELIVRLLTVAKLEAYAEPLSTEIVNVKDLVVEVVRNAGFEAQHRRVTVQTTFPEHELRICGNITLLYSALENVVRNAIQYTDPETEVRVDVCPMEQNGEQHVRIRVSDCGPGVPESELENVFCPFYRVDESRDREIGGTGLA